MKLTIFIREKVEPKFLTVQVPDNEDDPNSATHPEQRLNQVPAPTYPATFIKMVWYDRNQDYYGDSGDP